MDGVIASVADDILNAFIATSADATSVSRPLMVAIAGIPGSGKTTLATRVAEALCDTGAKSLGSSAVHSGVVSQAPTYAEPELPEFAPAGGITAQATLVVGNVAVVGMDGYHKYRSELDAMPNKEEAYRRRGAEWTFDAPKLLRDVAVLRETGRLAAPTFDHALKDPTPEALRIDVRTTTQSDFSGTAVVARGVVIMEGLYLALRDPEPWGSIADVFDLIVFVNCPVEVATERLVRRHMSAWGIPREEAMARASGSDRINAELVLTTAINAHIEVDSIDDSNLGG